MKIIICLILLMAITEVSISQSVMIYQAGTGLEVQTGANICADSVIMNGTLTGGGTICGLLYTLNLTMLIQGFYDTSTDSTVEDTVTVFLRNNSSPYEIIDSAKSYLSSAGEAAFTFANIINGVNYYIQLKQRNSLETWSNTGQVFTAGSLSYNFTTANTQAFGNNMINVNSSPVRYAIYSGDVNQDGSIDLSDIIMIFNDASNFVSGYVVTDINGDDQTDLTDLTIGYNNSNNYVAKIIP